MKIDENLFLEQVIGVDYKNAINFYEKHQHLPELGNPLWLIFIIYVSGVPHLRNYTDCSAEDPLKMLSGTYYSRRL
ncbi:MAG: hypothetical protein AAFP87_21255 [Pseudomonadota bacterium]